MLPRNNRDSWLAKLERNVQRDREKDAQLELMGWTVMHVWEHEGPSKAADTIEQMWRSIRQPTTRRVEPATQEGDV